MATSPATFEQNKWRTLGVLAAGLSMIVLDGTIVGVALPTIIADLHLDLTDAQWVNSLYSVIFAALLLASGRLGDRIGRRTTFLAGTSIFVLGSLTAAMATSATALISSRALQGVGGALVLPATLSSVNSLFRGKDRAAAFGVWGAVMSGMAALGPLLGGWLTQNFSWPWIFWVNLPLGLAVLAGTLLWVPQTHGKPAEKGVDVDGLLTSALGFGLLVFALIEGPSLGWWRPEEPFVAFGHRWPASWNLSPVPVCAAVGLVFVLLFLRWEKHRARVHRDALLDLSLLRIPTFSWGNLTAMAVAVGEFSLVLVLPLFLVNAAGLSTMRTGLVLAAMALGAFFSGASARHLAARLGAPGVVVLGLALEVLGVLGVAATVAWRSPLLAMSALLVVYGIGLGLASAQLTSTVLADIPEELSGQGSATQSTVRQLGSAIGSALAGTVLAVALARTLPRQLAGIGLPQQVLDELARSTTSSAGGVISGLRAQGAHGQLGAQAGDVVAALSHGFAVATGWTLLASAAFLALGLLGSLQVLRASRARRG